MAVTIFTGNFYLKLQYLKEYFSIKISKNKNQDNSIIIREKIVLNLKHEINHGLIRAIDDEKKANFFLKSENSKNKAETLVLEYKCNRGTFCNEIKNERGNCFDFKLYQGFYFDTLLKSEANFFLDIKNIKDEKDYIEKFNKIMENSKDNPSSSINKFNTTLDEPFPYFKSSIFGNQ